MIKLKPSYQTSDNRCFSTYEEAQQAELTTLFTPPDERKLWLPEQLVAFLLTHAEEIREILKPPMGRPTGSKNGAGKRRKKRIEFGENTAVGSAPYEDAKQ